MSSLSIAWRATGSSSMTFSSQNLSSPVKNCLLAAIHAVFTDHLRSIALSHKGIVREVSAQLYSGNARLNCGNESISSS